MMKKLFLLICTLGLILVSCKSHTHEISENWFSDSENHWHTCSGCEEILDLASHTYGEWTVVQAATETATGTEKRFCTFCKYEEFR